MPGMPDAPGSSSWPAGCKMRKLLLQTRRQQTLAAAGEKGGGFYIEGTPGLFWGAKTQHCSGW